MNEKMKQAKEQMINAIKAYIDERFNDMTLDEYEALSAGDGTLTVLDEALKYLEFSHEELEQLSDYCCIASDEVYHKYYTYFENFSEGHKQLLERMADSIMQAFAESVTAEQYDDQDEWLDFLQKFECLNYQEMRYIDSMWTDEAKEKYRIQKD